MRNYDHGYLQLHTIAVDGSNSSYCTSALIPLLVHWIFAEEQCTIQSSFWLKDIIVIQNIYALQ